MRPKIGPGARDERGYYLKFDLTKASLASLPEVAEHYKKTGAIRVCVVCRTHGAWDRIGEIPATFVEDTVWRLILIPSIEGNELWLVPDSRQSSVEVKLGFDKLSKPLCSVLSKTALALTYRDPVFRNEVHFVWKTHVICTSITGMTLLSPTDKWTLEQLETLKDLGCFAFED